MTFALTANGLQLDTRTEIVERLRASFRAEFGVGINVRDSSVFGRLINKLADEFQQQQNTIALVYSSMDPASAVGAQLDARAALTGSQRLGATQSTVDGILTFSAAGTVSDGDQFQNDDASTIWEAYNGPYTVAAAGTIDASLRAVETGPKIAAAGTTWSLVTANPDLTSFTNPTDDAEVGRDQETDGDFRRRRALEVYAAGQGPLAAVAARVSRVNGVERVRVYHNPATSPVDSDGIPFKMMRVVVGTNPAVPTAEIRQAIADAMWIAQGGGGGYYGTSYTETITDSEGQAHSISFDLETEVQVYISVSISTTNTEQKVSANMAETVKAYILAQALENYVVTGRDPIAGEFEGLVWDLQKAGQISGATGVTVQLSTTGTGGPYSNPLSMGALDRPAFDSAAILVTVT